MTVTTAKQESILQMVERITPKEPVGKVIDALYAAWKRSADGANPMNLGEFNRSRDNLTLTELQFVKLYLEKRAGSNIAPEQSHPPSVGASVDTAALIQKVEEKTRAKMQKEYEMQLATNIEAALNAEREKHKKTIEDNRIQYKLIHDAALQKAIAEERKAIEIKKQQLQEENEAKLEREKNALTKSLTGTSSQQIQSEKLNASLTAKAEIAEAKAKLIAEFDTKTSEKVEQERQRCETFFAKEKRQLIAKHQADTEGWLIEKETLQADKVAAIEAAEAEKRFLLNDKVEAIEMLTQAHEANIETLKQERDQAQMEADKHAWKKKLPSLYDVVNITSNIFALSGFVVLFKWVGVLAFIITACSFYAIVQDAKKGAANWIVVLGVLGAGVIETYYGYSHLNLFETLLKGPTYPFGIDYTKIAWYFTLLISGGSVYSVVMTALRYNAKAEAQRIADINNSLV